MTNVTYAVKKNGFKGSIKVRTLDEARAKAKEIGGYYKAVYTNEIAKPLTEKEIELRDKRIAYFAQKRVGLA